MRQHQNQESSRMAQGDAIVNPVTGIDSLSLGPLAVMVSTVGDLNTICRMMDLSQDQSKPLFISRIYTTDSRISKVSLTGPFVGAPYAVMILETLIAGGVREVIFFGWCGAISPQVSIGDVLVPTSAIIDEGTSKHYFNNGSFESGPSESLVKRIKAALRQRGLSYHEGRIWSTDAIFRETKGKVRQYQSKQVLAVEMEASALFTVGKYHHIDVGGVLVVSDELSTLKWQPGFKQDRFKQGRTAVCEVIKSLWRQA